MRPFAPKISDNNIAIVSAWEPRRGNFPKPCGFSVASFNPTARGRNCSPRLSTADNPLSPAIQNRCFERVSQFRPMLRVNTAAKRPIAWREMSWPATGNFQDSAADMAESNSFLRNGGDFVKFGTRGLQDECLAGHVVSVLKESIGV